MLKVILIDPARQQISETRIQPNHAALFQLIGCPNPVLVWTGYETRVAFSKELPQEGAFFCLPGSPKLFSKGVIFGCQHDGTLCDVPLPVTEAQRMVWWGRTARTEVSAARRQEARCGL
jgi:hypothetical protein